MQEDNAKKIASFYHQEKRMPTYTEMLGLFGFKSKNAVYRLVSKLEEAGIVAKDHLGRLMPTKFFNEIPMLGSVKAGFPSHAEALTDTINLEDFLVQKKGNSYFFEVDGKSMIDAHIDDGDMVLAEKTNQAKDGDIVIANVDGEFTMKYFKKNGNKVWLEPANKAFKPIYPEEYLEVIAVVKAVIRKY